MKERKDGRYLNCYITRTLLEEFEVVCDIQGRTKTGVLEEAMQKAIDPFYSRGENGCEPPMLDPVDGIYKMPHPKKPGKIKKVKCIILDRVKLFGVLSYKIYIRNLSGDGKTNKTGQILTVPISEVDIV